MDKIRVRLALDPGYDARIRQIMKDTGIRTLSQLVTILLVTYGDHLSEKLKQSASKDTTKLEEDIICSRL